MKRAILVLVLLLAACNGDDDDYPITDRDFQKGTEGLVFEFMDQAPPESVFEGQGFEIASDVWNRGAYAITKGYITAIVEDDYMCILENGECAQATGQAINPAITKDITELEPAGTLGGRSVYTQDGNAKHLHFDARARKLDLLSVEHTSPVMLTACYLYITELAENVCVDPKPTSQADKVCEVQDIGLTDQGAPMAITRIETRMLREDDKVKPSFLIYVKNKGDGQVIAKDKLLEACTAEKLFRQDIDQVVLSEFSFSNEEHRYTYLGDGDIECKPNPLKLSGEEDFVKCTFREGLDADFAPYQTQVYVKLEYGYTKTITKSVLIEQT